MYGGREFLEQWFMANVDWFLSWSRGGLSSVVWDVYVMPVVMKW